MISTTPQIHHHSYQTPVSGKRTVMSMEQLVMIRKVLLLPAVVLPTVVLIQDSAADDDEDYNPVTVHVTNKLSSRMALMVHCRCGYVDLGARAVEADSNYMQLGFLAKA
ncbi:unnamed protein product [Linum trigynum]|uniref:Uncharacterized protein n=1 Tax=Linum trigynum TaxID=586398 RepID=A0AAV2FQG5_9ROSI